MPEHTISQDAAAGPTLRDCEVLIARIDGTIAALARERRALERRVTVLRQAPPRQDTAHAD